MSDEEDLDQGKSGSLMSHLVELRDRVVRMVLAVLIIRDPVSDWEPVLKPRRDPLP